MLTLPLILVDILIGNYLAIKSLASLGVPDNLSARTVTFTIILNVLRALALADGVKTSKMTLSSQIRLVVARLNLNETALGFLIDTSAETVIFTLVCRVELLVKLLNPSNLIEFILIVGFFTLKTVNARIMMITNRIIVVIPQQLQHLMHLLRRCFFAHSIVDTAVELMPCSFSTYIRWDAVLEGGPDLQIQPWQNLETFLEIVIVRLIDDENVV